MKSLLPAVVLFSLDGSSDSSLTLQCTVLAIVQYPPLCWAVRCDVLVLLMLELIYALECTM